MTPRQRADAIIRFLVRQSDALSRTGATEWVSAGALADAIGAGVDRTTIFRDFRRLVADGVVEPQGPTRSRIYRLKRGSLPYLEWELAQPPEARQKVPYDPGILSDYEPNRSEWLSKERKERLASLAQPDFNADAAAYRRVMNSLLIDLSYASSRLEDVQISWLDTKSLVELGVRPDGLSDQEYRIVMNHKDAIQFICDHRGVLDLSKRNLLDVHRLLTSGLLGDPSGEGRLRHGLVYFTESAYRPIGIPAVLEEQVDIFCEKANRIRNPFERALFTMAFIPYLQPFQDGNKRTSRLCMNIPLLRESLAPFSFSRVDRRAYVFGLIAFYERGRPEFLADVFFDTYVKSAPKYMELLELVNEGGIVSTIETEKSVKIQKE